VADEKAENERIRRENEALKKTIADLAVDAILKEANDILKKKQTTPAWFKSPRSTDPLFLSVENRG
jgi:hypothetical protein